MRLRIVTFFAKNYHRPCGSSAGFGTRRNWKRSARSIVIKSSNVQLSAMQLRSDSGSKRQIILQEKTVVSRREIGKLDCVQSERVIQKLRAASQSWRRNSQFWTGRDEWKLCPDRQMRQCVRVAPWMRWMMSCFTVLSRPITSQLICKSEFCKAPSSMRRMKKKRQSASSVKMVSVPRDETQSSCASRLCTKETSDKTRANVSCIVILCGAKMGKESVSGLKSHLENALSIPRQAGEIRKLPQLKNTPVQRSTKCVPYSCPNIFKMFHTLTSKCVFGKVVIHKLNSLNGECKMTAFIP